MRYLLIFALSCLSAFVENPPADTLPGLYAVNGMEGENAYFGVAMIRKTKDGYTVQTATATETEERSGSALMIGVGMRDGAKLSVAWKAGNALGITIFTIGKDGSLTGKWISHPGGGETRTEKLKRIGDLPGGKAAVKESLMVHTPRPQVMGPEF